MVKKGNVVLVIVRKGVEGVAKKVHVLAKVKDGGVVVVYGKNPALVGSRHL